MWWITLIVVIMLTNTCIPRGNLTHLWGIFNAHIWFGNTMLSVWIVCTFRGEMGLLFSCIAHLLLWNQLLCFFKMSCTSLSWLVFYTNLCNILLTVPWDFSRLSWKTTGLSRGYWEEESCDSHFCLFIS